MKNWLFVIVILAVSGRISAQDRARTDSLRLEQIPVIAGDSLENVTLDTLNIVKKDSTKFYPKPSVATRLALIPGAGQIYNRDYWKVPIVYLAMGGGLYTYYLNTIKYRDFLAAYKSFYVLVEGDSLYGQKKPGLNADSRLPVRVRNLLNTSSETVEATEDQIIRQKNYWRRNRGFALIVTGLIYGLSIIEANVAAHLKTFDLSDDLSLRVEPKVNQPNMRTVTPGLRLVFNVK